MIKIKIVTPEKNIQIVQQDIREIQLVKSAIYSRVKILMDYAGLSFSDIDEFTMEFA